MQYLQQGTPIFRRVTLSLFLGGLVTFSVLYCTQPLMPIYTRQFHVIPAVASISLSITTAVLSVSMIVVASLSEAWGRKPVMTVSLFASSLLVFLTAVSPNFYTLLFFRALLGLVLAGLPAIAMAYLGEEVDPASLGIAMGLYISGNSIGGMSGRIVTGMLTDFFSWRIAIGVIGAMSLLISVWFWLSLPPSANFHPRPLDLKALVKNLWKDLRNPKLLSLYCIGFLLLGGFVCLYNYIGYQLMDPPYNLSQTVVGWIFIVYLTGTFSSAWMGKLSDSMGRRKILLTSILIMFAGAMITLETNLFIKIIGIAVFTFGFFGGHSVASAWVGKRAVADKAQASSLYLFFYYIGSSFGGSAGGLFWQHFGWYGVVGMIACFLSLALLLAARTAGD